MDGPGCCCIHPRSVVVTPISSCGTGGAQTPLQRPQGHWVLTCSFLLLHPAGLPRHWQEPHVGWHHLARIASPWRDA